MSLGNSTNNQYPINLIELLFAALLLQENVSQCVIYPDSYPVIYPDILLDIVKKENKPFSPLYEE